MCVSNVECTSSLVNSTAVETALRPHEAWGVDDGDCVYGDSDCSYSTSQLIIGVGHRCSSSVIWYTRWLQSFTYPLTSGMPVTVHRPIVRRRWQVTEWLHDACLATQMTLGRKSELVFIIAHQRHVEANVPIHSVRAGVTDVWCRILTLVVL